MKGAFSNNVLTLTKQGGGSVDINFPEINQIKTIIGNATYTDNHAFSPMYLSHVLSVSTSSTTVEEGFGFGNATLKMAQSEILASLVESGFAYSLIADNILFIESDYATSENLIYFYRTSTTINRPSAYRVRKIWRKGTFTPSLIRVYVIESASEVAPPSRFKIIKVGLWAIYSSDDSVYAGKKWYGDVEIDYTNKMYNFIKIYNENGTDVTDEEILSKYSSSTNPIYYIPSESTLQILDNTESMSIFEKCEYIFGSTILGNEDIYSCIFSRTAIIIQSYYMWHMYNILSEESNLYVRAKNSDDEEWGEGIAVTGVYNTYSDSSNTSALRIMWNGYDTYPIYPIVPMIQISNSESFEKVIELMLE